MKMKLEEENAALKKELAEIKKWRRIEVLAKLFSLVILLLIVNSALIMKVKYG